MNYTDIIIKLRKIIRSINLESKRIEKEHGISIPQLLCLELLSQKEDYRATSSMIKDHLNLNASTVSGIIKRLELKGLVAKLPKPDDKRASYITLTAKGMDLLKASPTTLQHKLSTRLSHLPSKQIATLNESIDLLINLLDAGDIDAAPIVTTQEIP